LVVFAEQRVCDGCTGPDLLELSKISWHSNYPSSHVVKQKEASNVLSFLPLAILVISPPLTKMINQICFAVLAGQRGCDGCTSPDKPKHGQIS